LTVIASEEMSTAEKEMQQRLNDGVLLVIVGAGASYDCLPERELDRTTINGPGLPPRSACDVRPPLTKDLVQAGEFYNKLVVRYPQCRPVVDDLRRRLRTTQQRSLTLIRSHITAMCFYLRDLLWASTDYMLSADLTGGVTNYTTLVRRLRQWATSMNRHVCFVSFNYDLLLDYACRDDWGLNPLNLASYVSDPYTTLIKPHGSVHWAWPLASQSGTVGSADADAAAIAAGSPVVPPGTPIRVDTTPGHRPSRLVNCPVTVPALAFPMPAKTESDLVWPPEQQTFVDALQGRVRRLLIIGWRAAEPEFVGRLQQIVMCPARVLIASGGPSAKDDAQETSDNLKLLDRAEDRTHDGFSGLFDDQGLAWLLEDIQWPRP